jgi:hypothetical protein
MATLLWEYSIGKGTEFSWQSVEIGLPEPTPLNGYSIAMRPKYDLGVITIGSQFVWPSWEITKQTISISTADCGTQGYVSAPKKYIGGPQGIPGPYSDPAGIVNGTGYIYVKTFDETEFFYLPAFSGDGVKEDFTGEIEVEKDFPYEPYNPDKHIYPMDTITRFRPDERESVTITYTIKTDYKISAAVGPQGIGGPAVSGTLTNTMTQVVTQEHHKDWGPQLEALLDRCYFTAGIYH